MTSELSGPSAIGITEYRVRISCSLGGKWAQGYSPLSFVQKHGIVLLVPPGDVTSDFQGTGLYYETLIPCPRIPEERRRVQGALQEDCSPGFKLKCGLWLGGVGFWRFCTWWETIRFTPGGPTVVSAFIAPQTPFSPIHITLSDLIAYALIVLQKCIMRKVLQLNAEF